MVPEASNKLGSLNRFRFRISGFRGLGFTGLGFYRLGPSKSVGATWRAAVVFNASQWFSSDPDAPRCVMRQWYILRQLPNQHVHATNDNLSVPNALGTAPSDVDEHYQGRLDRAHFKAWFQEQCHADAKAKAFHERSAIKNGRNLANFLKFLGGRDVGCLVQPGRGRSKQQQRPRTAFDKLHLLPE